MYRRTGDVQVLHHTIYNVVQVTDTSHTAGLTLHATILAYMFSLVEQDKITVPLGPGETNVVFIQVRIL